MKFLKYHSYLTPSKFFIISVSKVLLSVKRENLSVEIKKHDDNENVNFFDYAERNRLIKINMIQELTEEAKNTVDGKIEEAKDLVDDTTEKVDQSINQ